MKYQLRTDNVELSDLDRVFLDKKMTRLQKHLKPPYAIEVTIRRDSHHRSGEVITCVMNIRMGGVKRVLHSERTANTIQDCIDEIIHAADRELQKIHDKAKNVRPTIIE
jgi:ribosomal subunit interface protein